MITITLTYRNRELAIVKRCLTSLSQQTVNKFAVLLVNYGSSKELSLALQKLVANFSFVKLLTVPVSKQLWNKSKAINSALMQCKTPYFFVGDIDMMYRNDFVEKLQQLKNKNSIVYFQVGFLSKEESLKNKAFKDYHLKHISGKEATGMTLYPTALLKEINGYEEFYHGWGAEDSDVHRRIENLGKEVHFYTEEVLMLHQWHLRNYRTKDSKEPFHTTLEKINHAYYKKVIENHKVQANIGFEWGMIQEACDFDTSEKICIKNEKNEVEAFLKGILQEKKNRLNIYITKHPAYKNKKNVLKRVLKKKFKEFYSLQEINNLLLLEIISNYRNSYYEYEWDKEKETINLKIQL
ncbi:Glycosyl transferase family 2 [Lutibacter oricola]|uniref:Glycosyl transferase family 2 n=1 Tax=Lutibacter oricola TaxID=762486 RepID=A0A1H2WZV7_9FLAO|nr:galactosyltransferase-related protein [Lutibacter oricola]SDW86125.1 Glycosyl transferase family 2 [Lutibacter oricola]